MLMRKRIVILKKKQNALSQIIERDINFLIIHTDGSNYEVLLHRTCSDCAFLSTR